MQTIIQSSWQLVSENRIDEAQRQVLELFVNAHLQSELRDEAVFIPGPVLSFDLVNEHLLSITVTTPRPYEIDVIGSVMNGLRLKLLSEKLGELDFQKDGEKPSLNLI